MTFADRYVEQTRKAMEAFCADVFPQVRMDTFAAESEADIAAGRNVCKWHPDRLTMKRLWVSKWWCCDECAQRLFVGGVIGSGEIAFDMTPPKQENE